MKIYVCYTYRWDDDSSCDTYTEFWPIAYTNEQDAKNWIVKYEETAKASDDFYSQFMSQIEGERGSSERKVSRIEHVKRLQGWLDSNPFVQELIKAGCLSGYGLAELNYTYAKYKELELK